MDCVECFPDGIVVRHSPRGSNRSFSGQYCYHDDDDDRRRRWRRTAAAAVAAAIVHHCRIQTHR